MKMLFDIYTDKGSILSDSGHETTMPPTNLLDQVPNHWASTSSVGPHYVAGTATIGDGLQAPIDTFAFNVRSAQSGIIATLRLYDTIDASTPTRIYSKILDGTDGWKFFNITEISLVAKWELSFSNTVFGTFRVILSRVIGGLAWIPNIGASGDIGIDRAAYAKSIRKRNGGVFIPPSVNYNTQALTYKELDEQSTFSLLDALANYGSGGNVFVFGLDGTTALTITKLYGRIKEWSKPTLSISGNYSLSITIEESK